MTKQPAPKLMPARPRATQALNAAALNQFQSQPDPDRQQKKKKQQAPKNAISLALMSQF